MTLDLELQEIADAAARVEARNRIVNVVLYLAHIRCGKSLKDISEQTGFPTADIEKRVDYVVSQIRHEINQL